MPRTQGPPTTSKFLLLACFCIVISALYFAREVLIPIALAILLSFLLTPLVTRLEKWRLHRIPSVLIAIAATLAVIVLLGWSLNVQIANLAENVTSYHDNIARKFEALQPHNSIIGKLFRAAREVQQIATTQAAKATQPAGTSGLPTDGAEQHPTPVTIVAPTSPLGILGTYMSSILGPLGTAGLVIVFVIFILIQREDLRDRVIRVVGFGQLNVTTQAIDDAAYRISHYLSMLSIVNGCFATFVATGLYFLGIPNALLWGLLAGILRFIPYVGPWIGASFPMLLSLAVFPDNWHFFYTLGMFLAIELIVSQFIEPYLYGASTGMTPIAVLVAAVFWAWLWGPIGLLLSTPLTVLLVVVGKYIPQLRFLNILLSDEPVLEPQMRYYQRLLAMDAEEAEDVLDDALKRQSVDEVYDQIVIPALVLFKMDVHHDQIDEPKQQFILKAIREHIDQLGLHQSPAPPEPHPDQPTILCLPASDAIDALAALITAQSLLSRGLSAHARSDAPLVGEVLDIITNEHPGLLCISAIPPGAILHSRYLVKRVHPQFPDLPLVVALWGIKGDLKRAKERIATHDNAFDVVNTLTDLSEKIPFAARPAPAPAESQRDVAVASQP